MGTDSMLRALGKCLDVTSSGTANGIKIQLRDCNGTGAQVWQAQTGGALRNPQSVRCLNPTGGSADGVSPSAVEVRRSPDRERRTWVN